MVGRCRLNPVFASTEYDVLRLGSLTQCPCALLCDLITCYSNEGARVQRLKLKCDELVSSCAFNFNLRRYIMGVHSNLCTPKNGEILVAATQDFLTASYILTSRDMFLDRAAVGLLIAYMAGAYTRSLSSSARAVSDTKYTLDTP